MKAARRLWLKTISLLSAGRQALAAKRCTCTPTECIDRHARHLTGVAIRDGVSGPRLADHRVTVEEEDRGAECATDHGRTLEVVAFAHCTIDCDTLELTAHARLRQGIPRRRSRGHAEPLPPEARSRHRTSRCARRTEFRRHRCHHPSDLHGIIVTMPRGPSVRLFVADHVPRAPARRSARPA